MPRGRERVLIYVRERDAEGRPVIRAVPVDPEERTSDPPGPGGRNASGMGAFRRGGRRAGFEVCFGLGHPTR